MQLFRLIISLFLFLISGVLFAEESWTIFDAVEAGKLNNPLSAAAAGIVDEVRGNNRALISLKSPNLVIRYDDVPLGSGGSDYNSIRIGASQKFKFPTDYLMLAARNKLALARARADSLVFMADMETIVRKAYLTAWAEEERVRIAETFLDSLRQLFKEVQVSANLGEVSQFDYQRFSVQLIRAENELKVHKRQHDDAQEELELLTGVSINDKVLVSPLISDPIYETIDFSSTNISASPELIRSSAQLKLEEHKSKMANLEWLPDMEIYYFQEYFKDIDDADTWSLQLKFSLPLWFWWGGMGKVQIQKAMVKQSKANLMAKEILIKSECSKILNEMKSKQEKLIFYQEHLIPFADEAYSRAYQLYKERINDCFDLFDEMQDYKEVLLERLECEEQLYLNVIEYEHFCGYRIGM